MIKLGRRASLAFFLASLAACDSKKDDKKKKDEDEDDDDDDDKPSKKSKKDDKKGVDPELPSNERVAFIMGRSYAFAFQQGVLEKPDGVAVDMEKVRAGAELLGIAKPPVPTDQYVKHLVGVGNNLKAKHGEQLKALFIVGARLVNLHFTAAMKANVQAHFADLDSYFPLTKLPTSLWQDRYEKIKAAPTPEAIKALSEAILAHIKK